MSAPSHTQPNGKSRQQTGCYVYGILPGDVKLNTEIRGVGDPPGKVRLVYAGDLAALVSEVDLSGRLGTPEDLQAHKEILDATAIASPVLPVRFGSVLTDEDAVVSELLEPHGEEFTAALELLEGRAEYVINGRYVEQAILTEILSEDSDAARLSEQVRGRDEDATRDLRMQLGELINDQIAAKREKDTRLLLSAMADHCEASVVREPTHELDAAYVAFLIPMDQADEAERVADELAGRWEGRVELRVLGPMAPYDFVGGAEQARG
jgi:Gas vesicle synthesis protein GvpL/GvpF